MLFFWRILGFIGKSIATTSSHVEHIDPNNARKQSKAKTACSCTDLELTQHQRNALIYLKTTTGANASAALHVNCMRIVTTPVPAASDGGSKASKTY